MNNYHFDYSFLKHGIPVVTISSWGIGFNKGIIDFLGCPKEIMIGYDEANKAIGITIWNGDQSTPHYTFASREKSGWVRIGARDFTRYLSSATGINFQEGAKQFTPILDKENHMIIVIIDEDHIKS